MSDKRYIVKFCRRCLSRKSYIFILFWVFACSALFAQDKLFKDPFRKLKFDKVFAYNLNYDTIREMPVDIEREIDLRSKDFKLNNLNGVIGHRALSESQIKSFISIVSDSATYGAQHSSCFIPRHGFTFFYKGKDVLTILICFECGLLESTLAIPATTAKYYLIETTENNRSKTIKMFLDGFSEQGKSKLVQLCADLKMIYGEGIE